MFSRNFNLNDSVCFIGWFGTSLQYCHKLLDIFEYLLLYSIKWYVGIKNLNLLDCLLFYHSHLWSLLNFLLRIFWNFRNSAVLRPSYHSAILLSIKLTILFWYSIIILDISVHQNFLAFFLEIYIFLQIFLFYSHF